MEVSKNPENTTKKVLYGITKNAPFGGAQRYVFDLIAGAHASGYEVVCMAGGTGGLKEKLSMLGIRTLSVSGLVRDVGGSDLSAFWSIYTHIKREQPDVLHLNSSKMGALGALAGRLLGVSTIIYTDHGWAFKENRPLYQRTLIWLISWFTALLCHKLIAVSNFELHATRSLPFSGRKVVRIYNGIDLPMHFESGDSIRKAFPPGVKITGTVGELTRNKNHIALLTEARAKPDMYVAIVGEGELRPLLEQKIKEYGLEARVKLFGYKPATEVMKGFDVFALPSIKEALGYVILEARAAGLPILAKPVGGMKEAIEVPLEEFSKEEMIKNTLALY